MQSRFHGIGGALVLALALLALVLLGTPRPADAQSGISNFTTISVSRDVYAGGNVQLDGFLTLVPATALTVTDNALITPTTTLLPLAAAASVGLSGTNIAVMDAGRCWCYSIPASRPSRLLRRARWSARAISRSVQATAPRWSAMGRTGFS